MYDKIYNMKNILNSWIKIKSNTVYKAKRFSVKKDKVLLPDGQEDEYEYIEKKDFVLIIPRLGSSFVVVEQFRYPVKKRLIEFPQGVCNDNELPEKAAIRELQEETGLIPSKLMYLGRLDLAKASSSQGYHVYFANDFSKGQIKLDNTEGDLTVKNIEKQQIEKMIKKGKITDSPTIAAYTLYLLNVEHSER